MMNYSVKISAIIVLLLLSGFFSSSETAFFSLSRVSLRRRSLRKSRGFKYIIELLKVPNVFLTTVLIGNETVNISLSVVTAALVYSLARDVVSGGVLPLLSTLVTVPVLLLFGEIIPKTIAVKFPEPIARFNAHLLYLFSMAIAPLRSVLNAGARVFIGFFIKDPTKQPVDSVRIDEDMFKTMVDVGSREGTVEPGERDLILRTFRLDDILISRIMTPRDRIVAIPADSSHEQFMGVVEEHKYSRYPVYDGSLDRITGFVHAKDLLRMKGHGRTGKRFSVNAFLRTPTFVTEDKNALSVFLHFQKNKIHIGIVVDRRGKTRGIVTLEDILEELFGEIRDETDVQDDGNA